MVDKMDNTIVLYHGSQNEHVTPLFGKGNEQHDYGKGFYLTEHLELAREWAVCLPWAKNGWCHKYELDISGLKILDFEKESILSWLAELMKHREASSSKRYRMLARKFIEKYGIDTSEYDVIRGWRANASYFFIAKSFVKDEIDIDILEELLHMGGLGIQYFLKSEKAFLAIKEDLVAIEKIDAVEYNHKYNTRDEQARENMRRLVDSDKNKVEKVFSTLV